MVMSPLLRSTTASPLRGIGPIQIDTDIVPANFRPESGEAAQVPASFQKLPATIGQDVRFLRRW